MILQGLAAVSHSDAKVLILGSMPGAQSLAQQQYYAHPRNAFWPIMAALTGFDTSLAYPQRLEQLLGSGIALWDVIGTCQRQGSLDSAIRHEQVNDLAAFFAQHPQLAAIAFNGAKAWQSFKRHVKSAIFVPAQIELLCMPSTSPAHASLRFEQKLARWQQLKKYLD